MELLTELVKLATAVILLATALEQRRVRSKTEDDASNNKEEEDR